MIKFETLRHIENGSDVLPLLELNNVSVRNGTRLVLDNLDLKIYSGDYVRVSGKNGTGKSTLLNAIMGIVPIESGQITFLGIDISQKLSYERSSLGIRYMMQRNNIFPSLTVRDNLKIALGKNGYVQFAEKYKHLVKDISPNKVAGLLSGGQKQRLAWGMTVLSTSKLILVDEASSGISDMSFINYNQVKTIISVEHL